MVANFSPDQLSDIKAESLQARAKDKTYFPLACLPRSMPAQSIGAFTEVCSGRLCSVRTDRQRAGSSENG